MSGLRENQKEMKEQQELSDSLPRPAYASLMGKYLTKAILLEVTADPKPGLVTRKSNGAHNDMSIFTFMMSSSVLSRAFYDLNAIGATYMGTPKELFASVREYGRGAEAEMLKETDGVNTQRGILFAGGVLAAAAGYVRKEDPSIAEVIDIVRQMTAGIVQAELKSLHGKPHTYGETLFHRHGLTGIRGEVEAGFPTVLEKGLPALRESRIRGSAMDDMLTHALISLMTTAEDTNIIWRSDLETAQKVKCLAQDILDSGSVFTASGRQRIKDMNEWCIREYISPGGSADLLSISIALYCMDRGTFPIK